MDRTKAKQEHFEEYEQLAQSIGVDYLLSIVSNIASNLKIQMALFQGDEHLNTIRLKKWDAMHLGVLMVVKRTGRKSWSLADSVCVLKHVARHHAIPNKYTLAYTYYQERLSKEGASDE